MFSKRLLTAVLEPLLLSLLADGPKYGYEIIKRVRRISGGRVEWSNSQLYPLLHQLEATGLVEVFWRPSDSGPDRKYYRLTRKGHMALESTKSEWISMLEILTGLWSAELSVG